MKLKSHSGAKKRIQKTGTGKLKHRKAAKNHLLFSKSKRQKKVSRLGVILSETSTKKIQAMLPYSA